MGSKRVIKPTLPLKGKKKKNTRRTQSSLMSICLFVCLFVCELKRLHATLLTWLCPRMLFKSGNIVGKRNGSELSSGDEPGTEPLSCILTVQELNFSFSRREFVFPN